MKTLIWKEYRNNNSLLIIGIGLLLLPFFAISILMFSSMPEWPQTADDWKMILSAALLAGGIGSLILSQMTMLFLGGQIIAGERSTPTFQFLFYLPPTRTQIVLSKLVFCLLVYAAIWLFYGIGAAIALPALPVEQRIPFTLAAHLEVAATGLAMFGFAWLASSKLETPTLAMGIGALFTAAIAFTIQIVTVYAEVDNSNGIVNTTRTVFFAVSALITIPWGCFSFIRRIEP